MDKLQEYSDKALEVAIFYVPKLFLAAIVFFIGFWAIKKIVNIASAGMKKAKLSEDIRPFLSSMLGIVLKVVVIFVVLGLVGIQTASFVAVLAAAGFAVGMALQGSLGNFAAGIIVLIFRPYKVGDWIEVQEKFGQVKSIQIFHTVVITPGKKTLIVPNGEVISGIITNFSTHGYIRLELNVTMPYDEDFPKVKELIFNTIKDVPHVLTEPVPEIGIDQFDSHNIVLAVRPYTTPEYFWDVHFEVYKRIKTAFHDASIKVAYSEGVEMGKIGE